jgi:hypothetical protein
MQDLNHMDDSSALDPDSLRIVYPSHVYQHSVLSIQVESLLIRNRPRNVSSQSISEVPEIHPLASFLGLIPARLDAYISL